MLVASYAQETSVRFFSNKETTIFVVKKIYVDSSKTLTSDLGLNSMSLELLTISPSTVTLANGMYLLSLGGVSNYNRVFALNAKVRTRTSLSGEIRGGKNCITSCCWQRAWRSFRQSER
jgi:hypothetical protein